MAKKQREKTEAWTPSTCWAHTGNVARIPQSVQREEAVLLTMGSDTKYLVEKESTQKETSDETDQQAQNAWRTPGL